MTNYVLNEEKMFADITDGIAIIINSETGIYYGMNGFATVIYENLASGASSEDILAAIKQISGAPIDIETRYNAFLKALVENELMIKTESGTAAVNISEEVAKEDSFEIKIKAYDDAQELLLADPIHEVKEDTGWTPEKDSIGYTKEETKERERKMEE